MVPLPRNNEHAAAPVVCRVEAREPVCGRLSGERSALEQRTREAIQRDACAPGSQALVLSVQLEQQARQVLLHNARMNNVIVVMYPYEYVYPCVYTSVALALLEGHMESRHEGRRDQGENMSVI